MNLGGGSARGLATLLSQIDAVQSGLNPISDGGGENIGPLTDSANRDSDVLGGLSGGATE